MYNTRYKLLSLKITWVSKGYVVSKIRFNSSFLNALIRPLNTHSENIFKRLHRFCCVFIFIFYVKIKIK